MGGLGKKAGKGFYDYPKGGTKRLWPGLAEIWPTAVQQPDVAEVKRRLMFIQLIETVRCMEEGVVTAAIDADVGAILGWGFPPYLGGPVGQIHSLGVARFVTECEQLAHRHGPRFAPPELLRKMARENQVFYQR